MTAPTRNPLSGLPIEAREAKDLIDRLARWGEEARTALESNDLDLLEHILDERDTIVKRLGSIFNSVRVSSSVSSEGSDSTAANMQSHLDAVFESATVARNADALLASGLECEMVRIGRELDQMESDRAVRSAYGQSPRKRRQINVIR